MSEKKYRINEIFYSLQGEGVRQGTANVFVRFSGCNLKCAKDDPDSGFDCDTEFVSGVSMTRDELVSAIFKEFPDLRSGDNRAVIFTGGEPSMQLDHALVSDLKLRGTYLAIETNGTNVLPTDIDWVCVSPKSAEHTLRVTGHIDELKYVRHVGQGIPKPSLTADHYLISPAFNPDWTVNAETVKHCIELVKNNPAWRFSMQMHKLWGVR